MSLYSSHFRKTNLPFHAGDVVGSGTMAVIGAKVGLQVGANVGLRVGLNVGLRVLIGATGEELGA